MWVYNDIVMGVMIMLEYILLMTAIGVVAISAAVHYMHKAGYNDHDIHV